MRNLNLLRYVSVHTKVANSLATGTVVIHPRNIPESKTYVKSNHTEEMRKKIIAKHSEGKDLPPQELRPPSSS